MPDDAKDASTIVQQAIERAPWKKASAAVHEIQDTAAKAFKSGYNERSYDFQTPTLFAFFSGLLALGVVASFAVPVLPFVFGAVSALLAIASVGTFHEVRMSQAHPYRISAYNFELAVRNLTSAAAGLPDEPMRQSMRQFADGARRDFVLGYVATLQAEIVRGDSSESRKRHKEGIGLIEGTAAKMKRDDADALKTAFRDGKLPEPEAFAKHLSDEHDKIQTALENAIQRIQPDPNAPRPPNSGDAHKPSGPRPS